MPHALLATALALALQFVAAPVSARDLPIAGHTPAVQDTTPLQFHGVRAGATLRELDARVRRLGGRLRCDRARRDPRVSECRGTVRDSTLGGAVQVWASARDSVAGVITLSADLDQRTLDRWRSGIESRYGRVGAKVQGAQRMMQWVRRGRMLRLTWRSDRRGHTASVSLVDGRALDSWADSSGTTPRRASP